MTCHDEGSIIVSDALTGNERTRFKPHEEAVRYACYSSDGAWLFTASTDRTAAIIDPTTFTVVRRFVHHPGAETIRDAVVNGIELNRDGTIALTCGHDGFVRFWDVESGALLYEQRYLDGAEITMARFSPDGAYALPVGSNGVSVIADAGTGAVMTTFTFDVEDEPVQMIHAAFTPDSRHVAISHMKGHVSIRNIDIPDAISDSFRSVSGEAAMR